MRETPMHRLWYHKFLCMHKPSSLHEPSEREVRGVDLACALHTVDRRRHVELELGALAALHARRLNRLANLPQTQRKRIRSDSGHLLSSGKQSTDGRGESRAEHSGDAPR